jgi:hypothetical protein
VVTTPTGNVRKSTYIGLCGFSLVGTGLVGGGSIPPDITCLGGVLAFLGLSALSFLTERPHKQRREEVAITLTGKTRSNRWFRLRKSVISTLWAVGTGMWSALALSG